MLTDLVTRYNELQKKVEEAQTEANKAEGAKEQVMKRLKELFGCTTIVQAKKKLKKLRDEVDDAEIEFSKAMDTFEKEWGEKTQ